MDIKTIDFLAQKTFVANGKNYIVRDKVTIRRYREYQKLEPYLALGIGTKEIWDSLTKIEAANNKGDRNAIAVSCHNMKNGIKDATSEERFPIAMQMCALVIDREDEDPGQYDPTIMQEKMKDWEAEGLDVSAFFTMALISIPGFKETFLSYTQELAKTVTKSDLMRKDQ